MNRFLHKFEEDARMSFKERIEEKVEKNDGLRRHSRKPFFALGIIFTVVLLAAIGLVWSIPAPEVVRSRALGSDRVLLASNGLVLQNIRMDFTKRRMGWYPLADFSSPLQTAILSIEDQRFYEHQGVDFRALGRALFAMLKGQRIQGASTITMQLTDMIQADVLEGQAKIRKGSFSHKGLQILRAIALEWYWEKAEIMEAYLNLIHLRGELQGVPAYSYAILNKHPLAIDNSEALLIALQIASPNMNQEKLLQRACHVLEARSNLSSLSCLSIKEEIVSLFQRSPRIPLGPNEAPHLAIRLFQENPGKNWLETTIDSHLQKRVSEILNENIGRLKNSKVQDSAAIVIENRTGKILAYVGAVGSSESPHVDGVKAYRQAGSALKPFLYAKAIDSQTVTAASILMDDPTALSWNGQIYRPTNYDKQFNGPVSLREALASSLNVPAVKIVTIIGLHESYKVLQNIGLKNLKEPDFYGVSMALGAVEVKLEDLTNAYRIFANHGEWRPLQWLTSQELLPNSSIPLFSAEASYIVSTILSDTNARSIGFGWESPLDTPFWTAVKTGTSKDYRDNWCVGFSENYTVGVWTGNFDATAMEKVSGVTGAGPSWNAIMQELHRDRPSREPVQPEKITALNIRHPWSSVPKKEYFIKGTEPSHSEMELANDKQVQFVFPAEGSILIEDPHLDSQRIALAIRYKGAVLKNSVLLWDGKVLGTAVSPFILSHPKTGEHHLAIQSPDGKILARVRFVVKGLSEGFID